jgi:putative copper export protein
VSIGVLGVISRWFVFTGILVAVGAVVFDLWVLRGDSAAGEEEGDSGAFPAAAVAARLGALAAIVLLLGAAGRLINELVIFRDPFEPWAAELNLLVTGTSFGTSWMAQFGLGLLACLAFLAASRRADARLPLSALAVAVLATVGLAITPAYSGHAAGSQHLRGLAIASDVAHVAAGGVWLGTLAVIAVVARRARLSGHPIAPDRLVSWIGTFSPMALVSAAVIGVTGVFASWLHLDALSSLWTSPYGQRLLVKIGVLTIVLACGAYNWRRSRGEIDLSEEPGRLPRSVTLELAAGIVILLVTAVLVTTPPPGE